MKKRRFDISIIIPIYNGEQYIEKCLNSLLAQTYPFFEIILIDDGSTDNTKSICESFLSSKIKYFYQSNSGVSSARNKGIQIAKNHYILFVDVDDVISNTALEMFVKNYQNSETLLMLHRMPSYISCQESYDNMNEVINMILMNQFDGFITGCLFEKKLVGRFDENTSYMEDMVFLIQYLLKVEKCVFINANYYYIVRSDSITGGTSLKKVQKNILGINYSLDQILGILQNNNNLKINDLQEKIVNKKAKVIESECLKILSISKILQLMEYEDVKDIFLSIVDNVTNIRFKFFYKLMIQKNYIGLSIYMFLRNILKKIKR